MKIIKKQPYRKFQAGDICISDCADIFLNDDQQITLKTDSETEFDIVKKDFGYYATPSLNGRLPKFNLKPVLIYNPTSELAYLLLVENGKEKEFHQYIKDEKQVIIRWLDTKEEILNLSKQEIEK